MDFSYTKKTHIHKTERGDSTTDTIQSRSNVTTMNSYMAALDNLGETDAFL